MKQRPASVTTAFRLFVVSFLLSLPRVIVLAGDVLPVEILPLSFIFNALLFLGLYKRLNWVRKLYIVCAFLAALYAPFAILGEFRAGVGWGVNHLAIWVLNWWITVLLMKKPAREWFRAKEEPRFGGALDRPTSWS